MDSVDYRATALLTEHLGFAPLTLVDEVINAVNQIMYNCTDALEAFLIKRRTTQIDLLRKAAGGDDVMLGDENDESGNVFSLDEIRHGTAQLETLFVSHVDKNFDKFELYTLRNILTIPRDLVEGGWVRLKHHENLQLGNAENSAESSAKIRALVENINLELLLRKILRLHLEKAKHIVALLKLYKTCVESIILANAHSKLTSDVKTLIKENLNPLSENVYFLLTQLSDLMRQVLQLNERFMRDETLAELKHLLTVPSNRDMYILEKSSKLLQEVDVISSEPSAPLTPAVLYTAVAHAERERT